MMRLNRRRRQHTAAAAAAFDPATETLSMWLRASFAGPGWTSEASAGTSASNYMVTGGTPPTVGVAVNGFDSADFDGTQWLYTNGICVLDALIGTGTNAGTAGSFACLFYADTAAADVAQTYSVPNFFSHENSGSFGFGFSDAGVRVRSDGLELTAACTTGAWHLAVVTMNGTTCALYVDDMTSAATSGAAAVPTTGAANCNMGANYNRTVFFDGKILEGISALNIAWDATQRGNIKSYIQSRYPATGL